MRAFAAQAHGQRSRPDRGPTRAVALQADRAGLRQALVANQEAAAPPDLAGPVQAQIGLGSAATVARLEVVLLPAQVEPTAAFDLAVESSGNYVRQVIVVEFENFQVFESDRRGGVVILAQSGRERESVRLLTAVADSAAPFRAKTHPPRGRAQTLQIDLRAKQQAQTGSQTAAVGAQRPTGRQRFERQAKTQPAGAGGAAEAAAALLQIQSSSKATF